MPCKHEGGSDPCEKYDSGQCKHRIKSYQSRYESNRQSGSSARGQDIGKITAATELLVAVDLLRRGLDVTKPLSPTSKHDLHAHFSSGWMGIQVKSGRINIKTGTLGLASLKQRARVKSPILAITYLPTNKIAYYPTDGTPLPPELIE